MFGLRMTARKSNLFIARSLVKKHDFTQIYTIDLEVYLSLTYLRLKQPFQALMHFPDSEIITGKNK